VAADFGFVNARVRGLRSRLLPSGFFGDQLAAEGFASLTGALGQSGYARDLEEARGSLGPLAAVDQALASNYVRATQVLLGAGDGSARALIALLLRRHDRDGLKAIVRGHHAGRSADDVVAAILPAGEIAAGVWRSMASAADLAGASTAFAATRHPLAEAFRRVAAAHRASRDLLAAEVAIDRAFYALWLADAGRLAVDAGFARYAVTEIDVTNLATALKLRGRPRTTMEFFVPGGAALKAATFVAIATAALGEPLPPLTGALAPAAGAVDVGTVDARLSAAQDALARRLSFDPQGIGLVVDYLRRKEREAAQLRLLARGKYYGVPRAALAKELGDA
jgi:V/A-type H+/Na+-transporting ATPase subunit C